MQNTNFQYYPFFALPSSQTVEKLINFEAFNFARFSKIIFPNIKLELQSFSIS